MSDKTYPPGHHHEYNEKVKAAVAGARNPGEAATIYATAIVQSTKQMLADGVSEEQREASAKALIDQAPSMGELIANAGKKH